MAHRHEGAMSEPILLDEPGADSIFVLLDSEEPPDDDVEIVSVQEQTQALMAHPEPQKTAAKLLSEAECPICFDVIENATVTLCGHVFCLECILQSISSSHARGQALLRHGQGLCPLCREKVVFKDTAVLRLKLLPAAGGTPPELEPEKREREGDIDILTKRARSEPIS